MSGESEKEMYRSQIALCAACESEIDYEYACRESECPECGSDWIATY